MTLKNFLPVSTIKKYGSNGDGIAAFKRSGSHKDLDWSKRVSISLNYITFPLFVGGAFRSLKLHLLNQIAIRLLQETRKDIAS